MSPLSRLLNQSVVIAQSDSFLARSVGSRFTTVVAGVPLEILAVAQNLIKLPFEAAQMVIKLPAKIINTCVDSPSLNEFASSLPGPIALLKTALKVLGYAIGAFFTATLGLLSPKANFNLHVFLSLVKDEKAEAQKLKANQEATKKREDQIQAMKAHLKNLIEAKKNKIIDKERDLEMSKEAERLAKQKNDEKSLEAAETPPVSQVPLVDDEEQTRLAAEEAAQSAAEAVAATQSEGTAGFWKRVVSNAHA
jgi:hypothetical protein